MNFDTLKYFIEYFDLKDFIQNNHPVRLLLIFSIMIALMVLVHIVSVIFEKKLMMRAYAKKGLPQTDKREEELAKINPSLFKSVMHNARLLVYLCIFGFALREIQLGPIYNAIVNLIFICLCTLAGVKFLSSFIPFYLDMYFRRHGKTLDKTQTRSLMPIIQGIIWAIGITFLLDNVGLHISTILAGLGIVGVAVGLAGQAILSDFFSYIVILVDKPFQIGDFVKLGSGEAGSVEYIGPKTTRLLSLDGDTIICANKEMTKGVLVNQGNIREREVIIQLGVSYATPIPTVRSFPDMLKEVVNAYPQCKFERACMLNFGAANFQFQLIYHVSPQPGGLKAFMQTQHDVNLSIQEMLNKQSITVAYPTETVYVANVPAAPAAPAGTAAGA